MKICIVHSRFSYVGGAEKYLYYLVRHLLEEGHQIDYYCNWHEPFSHPNLRFHHVGWIKPIRFLKALSFALTFEHRVDPSQYDVVHGFYKTFRQDVYTDGSGPVRLYKEYVLSQKRGWGWFRHKFSLYYEVDKWLEKKRFSPENHRKILCMSRLVKEQIQREYGLEDSRIQVLYNGLDCDFFSPKQREELGIALRRSLGVSQKKQVWSLVGSDYVRKNVYTALRALSQFPQKDEVELWIVGYDKHMARWKEEAQQLGVEGCVRFLGPRRDIEAVYGASDLLLLVSHYDAFGMVVAEAMACGVPTIVSSRAGASELVVGGRNGWILKEPSSFQELCQIWSYWMELSASEQKRMRDAARAAAERLDWKYHMPQLLKVYQEVAEEKRGGGAA